MFDCTSGGVGGWALCTRLHHMLLTGHHIVTHTLLVSGGDARSPDGPSLPEFYIMFEPEPRKANRSGWDEAAVASQHVARLMAGYEAADAASLGGHEGPEAGWGGEGYEPDAARGADAAYLKFAKHLALVPQQCVRYYRCVQICVAQVHTA